MFPSQRFIQEAFEQSLLSDANKAYAKLCNLCLNAKSIYHYAHVTQKSFKIQVMTRLAKGPCFPMHFSGTAISHLERCKHMLNELLEAPFPDDTDPELIELHKFCIVALARIENYNIYCVEKAQ